MEKNVLTIRVPSALKKRMHLVAKEQGVSINQLAVYAFSKELEALEAARFFEERNRNANVEALTQNALQVLSRVKDRPVLRAEDELPQ